MLEKISIDGLELKLPNPESPRIKLNQFKNISRVIATPLRVSERIALDYDLPNISSTKNKTSLHSKERP